MGCTIHYEYFTFLELTLINLQDNNKPLTEDENRK